MHCAEFFFKKFANLFFCFAMNHLAEKNSSSLDAYNANIPSASNLVWSDNSCPTITSTGDFFGIRFDYHTIHFDLLTDGRGRPIIIRPLDESYKCHHPIDWAG